MAKLLLFDIDGTMLRTGGVGSRAFLRAAEEVLGGRCNDAPLHVGGALDPLLFAEVAAHGGYAFDDEVHSRFRAAYHRELSVEFDAPNSPVTVMPGVLALLARLRAEPVAQLGMLTGNYAETGRLKLTRVGIDPDWFSPAVWGDAATSRPALVRHAVQHLPGVRMHDVIVIGDTPRDVACALENGARCLAVATGYHPVEELLAAGATRAVADLSDPAPLYELLES